jgi:ABC-type phosphate transport system substrate-binding protein
MSQTIVDAFGLDADSTPHASTSQDDVIARVESDPGALGIVSLKAAHERLIQSSPIRILPIGGVRPLPANVRSGDYPYVQPINLVLRVDAGDGARSLLDLARRGAARQIARDLRLIEVSPRISSSTPHGAPSP